MNLDHPMHYRDVPTVDVEYNDFPCPDRGVAHVEEENVPAVESGLHTSTENNDNLQVI